ncbi:MAG: FAD-dependent oxidoreductase [Patescibacteria group bacterium]
MKNIVIVGGGFGGVRCALDLAKNIPDDFKITLVDRSSSHVFTPSFYEVASAYPEADRKGALKLRQCVSVPYSTIFLNKNVTHLQGEVVSIDTTEKVVYIQDKGGLPYDYCVISVGSESTDFGTLGVSEYAYFFKTLEDALLVNRRVHELFHTYLNGSRSGSIQILVVGAGFTGIELASEVASCLRRLGKRHRINKKFFSVMLFEATPQMLPMISTKERQIISSRLTQIGVGMSERSPIESVSVDHIKMVDGHIAKGDMIIWTAGIKPSKLLSKIPGFTLSQHGKVEVDKYLNVKNESNLFAIGDSIEYIDPDNNQPVPALAYTAVQQGKVVAKNISKIIKINLNNLSKEDYHRYLKIYKPSYSAWIAPVGGKWALAHINKGLFVSGFLGWVFRYLVDLKYFISILPISKAIQLLKKDIFLFSQND